MLDFPPPLKAGNHPPSRALATPSLATAALAPALAPALASQGIGRTRSTSRNQGAVGALPRPLEAESP
ncbi:hypothetical protein ACKI2C_00180 [Streptomyces brasiliscabiei]|uniref:Uncharacterized protein n=1 Tax=Streptomyces brasiliscabiei TaxID=2736302 RepID=A0ABU8G463_9ACTN